ncbi:MAG: hypothetical protein ACRDJU_08440 [Actinomycetota bacterium]
MYGTVMRARVKSGSKEAFEASIQGWEQRRGAPEGYHSTEIAWEEGDTDRVVTVVRFLDKATYVANAESLEQDAEYRDMLTLLEGEPEWIDVTYGAYAGRPLPASGDLT